MTNRDDENFARELLASGRLDAPPSEVHDRLVAAVGLSSLVAGAGASTAAAGGALPKTAAVTAAKTALWGVSANAAKLGIAVAFTAAATAAGIAGSRANWFDIENDSAKQSGAPSHTTPAMRQSFPVAPSSVATLRVDPPRALDKETTVDVESLPRTNAVPMAGAVNGFPKVRASSNAMDQPTTVEPATENPTTIPTGDRLREEIELVRAARDAIERGDVFAARTAIARYRAVFPNGKLTPEIGTIESSLLNR